MSQPKRYRCLTTEEQREFNNKVIMPGLVMCEDGNLVSYSDYAALAAENERLRKAGDAMKHWIVSDGHDLLCVDDWLAAKEGRDAK